MLEFVVPSLLSYLSRGAIICTPKWTFWLASGLHTSLLCTQMCLFCQVSWYLCFAVPYIVAAVRTCLLVHSRPQLPTWCTYVLSVLLLSSGVKHSMMMLSNSWRMNKWVCCSCSQFCLIVQECETPSYNTRLLPLQWTVCVALCSFGIHCALFLLRGRWVLIVLVVSCCSCSRFLGIFVSPRASKFEE